MGRDAAMDRYELFGQGAEDEFEAELPEQTLLIDRDKAKKNGT